MKPVFRALASAGMLFAAVVPLRADLTLNDAGAPYAPTEVNKKEETALYLSPSELEDVMKEFRGLVAMGLRPEAYDRWGGRSMADCFPPDQSSESWRYRCEIITAQCNGFYYFFPNESRRNATLQQIDIKIHASENELMDALKKSVRSLFGRETVLEPRQAGVKARGPVRHWNTGTDVADLFVDVSENPAGLVRFVWKRSPLIGGDHADARTGN